MERIYSFGVHRAQGVTVGRTDIYPIFVLIKIMHNFYIYSSFIFQFAGRINGPHPPPVAPAGAWA